MRLQSQKQLHQQSMFPQQQPHRVFTSFSRFDQNSANQAPRLPTRFDHNPANQAPRLPTRQPMVAFANNGNINGPMDMDFSMQQEDINLQIQDIQERIQQVQDEIQQAQQTNNMIVGQHSMMNQQPQQQQNFSSMMGTNQSGMGPLRYPPGRSISMPIRRVQRSNVDQPTFMMQQPMQQLQQQQPTIQEQQQKLQQLQQQLQQQQQMQQQQAMMNISMDTSMNSTMSTNTNAMQGFNQQSIMQQQQQDMGNMGPLSPNPFGGDGGQIVSQNSMPQSSQLNLNQVGGNTLDFMANSVKRNFDQAPQMPRSFQARAQGNSGSGSAGQPGVNEAMEKLCESMRRSAMSRSLVKQLSGRSVSRTSSGRNLSRQNSATFNGRSIARANSGRSITRASSGRSIQRSSSGRSVLLGKGGELPVQRIAQDSKHRIQRDHLGNNQGPPGRGVFRHKSQGAIMGASKTVLNIDGNTIGMF